MWFRCTEDQYRVFIQGSVSLYLCRLSPQCRAHILMMRRSRDRLLFIMGIPKPGKTVFIWNIVQDLSWDFIFIRSCGPCWLTPTNTDPITTGPQCRRGPCVPHNLVRVFDRSNGSGQVTGTAKGHVTLAAITGTTILVLNVKVKSLQPIWRPGTRRFHLRVPDLQVGCRDLTTWEGTRIAAQQWLPGDWLFMIPITVMYKKEHINPCTFLL